ncbi:MAG: Gfo/Idh/MocA family protein [Planctomycetaceae bacterium]
MQELRFALVGAGFWSRFQLAGWRQAGGATCVAVCDVDLSKAKALAREFGVQRVYNDAEQMLKHEALDVLDIVASIEAHAPLVRLAAAHRLPVICQKPMASSLREAEEMVDVCRRAGVRFLVHENNRWYNTIRELRKVLDQGTIGRLFRARVEYNNACTPFANQPYLKDVEHLILADMGSHILDVARFLFGEATSLYCQTRQVYPGIRGEDVATVIMNMGRETSVTCELSYASVFEHDPYPEILVTVEGERGSVTLAHNHWVRVTTSDGTFSKRYPPPTYPWVDAVEGIGLTCIVPCIEHLQRALRGEAAAETTGEDNLKTMRLVYGSYESAARNQVVCLEQ